MALGEELRALHVLAKFSYHGAKSPAGFSICLFSSKQQFQYIFQSGFFTRWAVHSCFLVLVMKLRNLHLLAT